MRRPRIEVLGLALALLACGGPPAPPIARPRPAPPPAPAPVPAVVVSYEALLAAEVSEREPLAVEELSHGERAVHLVLDAGRCYRIVAIAERSVALSLVDEHAQRIAAHEGRVVRFEGVCPRWSGSFELEARLDGARGQVRIYEEPAPASSSSSPPVSSTTR